MLNLSELVFKVNTTELVEAANKAAALGRAVEDLSGSFNKLSKTSSDASKAQAKVEKDLAAAEASKAKANKDNAQAEAIKSKALEKTTKATEDATTATKASVSILERQQTILEYQANGYSKGQASILAYAKAAGVASSEIQEIGKVLQAQRTLMGGDPFDKSLGSLRSLQNEFRTLKEVQRLYTAEIPLTRKQMENLALDKLRLIEAMKTQGKTMSQIKAAIKDLNAEYIATANNINRVIKAEDAIDKSYKDAANANAYLEKEMQRVNYALQAQNNELNKGTANALNRFEQNLKRSGLTLDQQRMKMEAYRKSLLSLEKTKGGNTDYITRALGPQITDIFVGLATGQAPLTVMLQQGGQLRDQFALAGVAADDMGKTMRTAAKDMVVSVAAVARAFGDLLLGAFIDTGKGIVSLIGRVTGLTAALELARYQLTLFAMADGTFGGPLLKMFNMLRVAVIGFAAAAAATGVGALIALAVGFSQVVKENNALAKALAISGGSLAVSHNTAMDYVRTLGDMGVTTGKAAEALVAMAKAGVFSRDEILLVGKAAAEMATYADVSVEDTVKAFAKLKEKPVEALTDIAKSTGMVSIETLKMVHELQKAGKETEAAALAMQTYGDVSKQQVDQMKANYNSFSLYVMELGRTIKQFFSDIFKDLFLVSTEGMERELRDIETKLAKMNNSGGIFGGDVFGYNKEALMARQVELQGTLNLTKAQNAALEDQLKVNTENAKNFEDVNKVMKDVNSTLDKASVKTLTLTEYTKKYLDERKKLGKFSDDEIAKMEKAAKIEWEAAQKKPKGDKKENYYATLMRDATNSTIKADEATQNLTKSQIKMLEVIADPRFATLNVNQKSNILNTYAQAAANERIVEGQDLINQLLGKGEGLGKEYYDTLSKLEMLKGNAGIDQEELAKALQALRDTTPAAKKARAEIEAAAKAYNEYSANAIASLESTKLENDELDFRLDLMGKTADEQKRMRIQQDGTVKLMQAEVKYAREVLKIRQDTRLQNDPLLMAKALQDVEEAYAEERKTINRGVAVAFAEDLQREIDNVKNGITDSIVTAMFEGGKAGAKKFRDVVVGILRQKVTMVVDAVVNTLLGNVIGNFMGMLFGGGRGAAGAIAGGSNLLGMASNGMSLYSLASTGYAGAIGSGVGSLFGTTAGNAALGTSLGLGSSSSAAAATGASVAGGGTGAGAGLGSAIGAAAPYLLAIVALAASWKKLFGRTLKDSGIQGEFGGDTGFEGQQYKFYKGGLFRSDKTELSPLDEAMRKTLADSFKAMKDQVIDFAKILNLGTKGLDDFKSTFKLSLHGLSEQDANAKIQEALMTLNNELAQEVIGTWTETEREVQSTSQRSTGGGAAEGGDIEWVTTTSTVKDRTYQASEYAKEGEKAIDTLTRLATSLSTVNQVFDTLGVTLYDSSLAGGDMASKLADLFGGLEKFVESTTFYYQNFYTEAERQATAMRQLDAEFKKHNIALPKTREEYRKLVEAQDLTTEEGRKMYEWLLRLAPAFAEISQTAAEVEQAVQDKLNAALEDAYSALEKAVKVQIDLLKEQEAAQAVVVNNLRSIFDLLKKSVRELYMEVDSTASMLASQGRGVINSALAGNGLPDLATLSEAISAVRSEIEGTSYTTQFEADKARLQFAADLKKLQDQAGEQLTTEEQILKAIKDQIKFYEDLLIETRKQLDALLGINNSVLTVAQAIENLRSLMFPDVGDTRPEKAPGTGGAVFGGSSPSSPGTAAKDSKYKQVTSLGTAGVGYVPITDDAYISKLDSLSGIYHSFDGTGNLAGLLDAIKAAGGNLADLSALSGYYQSDWEKAANSVDKQFANGGAFTNGVVQRPTRFNIGEMGEAGSEGILPLANVGGKLGVHTTGSSNAALEQRVDNMNIALQMIVLHTSKMARILDSAQGEDGRSIMVSDAPTG